MRKLHSYLALLRSLALLIIHCIDVAESNDGGIGGIINGVGGNNNGGSSGCRLVMEKNEWAAGCM